MQTILDWLGGFVSWLLTVPLCWVRMITSELVTSATGLFAQVVYVSASGVGAAFAVVPSSIIWGLQFFRVPEALGIVMLAYVTRFLVRRIPFIN